MYLWLNLCLGRSTSDPAVSSSAAAQQQQQHLQVHARSDAATYHHNSTRRCHLRYATSYCPPLSPGLLVVMLGCMLTTWAEAAANTLQQDSQEATSQQEDSPNAGALSIT
jgi:hypothetical protein